jgi:hypothetical protein
MIMAQFRRKERICKLHRLDLLRLLPTLFMPLVESLWSNGLLMPDHFCVWTC